MCTCVWGEMYWLCTCECVGMYGTVHLSICMNVSVCVGVCECMNVDACVCT